MMSRARPAVTAARLFAACLLVSSALCPPAVSGGSFTVFGPAYYERGAGAPVMVNDAIAVRVPGAPYRILVYNGGLEDSEYERVSSSVIQINGGTVFGPDAFGQDVGYLEAPVDLSAANELSVELRGKPGGGVVLVLVGEGPGEEEDRQGLAFVGPAGQLLTRILTAIGLRRGQVYITNIVKCRPPGNRDPQEDEVAACLPFLRRQLAIIRPDLICTLGAPASRTLLETRAPISRLRGRFHRMGEMRVLPTYHPAYLLRNPSEKRAVWEDMQLLQRAYREPGTMGERS